MKLVSNNTPGAIYGQYKQLGPEGRTTIGVFLFKPGLNEVPNHILKGLLKEPGFQGLLDAGRLAKSKGDIDAAKDIKAAQDRGEDSSTVVPPVKPPNSTTAGAPLSKDQKTAVDKVKTGKKSKGA